MSKKNIEYWYDPKHTGTLHVLDHDKQIIYGSDPNELRWKVFFNRKDDYSLIVDFRNKKTHRGRQFLETTYKNMRNELHWSDGNVWRRIRLDPTIVLNYYEKH
jgi:hypothetical protein